MSRTEGDRMTIRDHKGGEAYVVDEKNRVEKAGAKKPKKKLKKKEDADADTGK